MKFVIYPTRKVEGCDLFEVVSVHATVTGARAEKLAFPDHERYGIAAAPSEIKRGDILPEVYRVSHV